MVRYHETDICNPNTQGYQVTLNNHSDQLNPKNDEYQPLVQAPTTLI
ncbi:MAG: hypothetical protein ACOH1X_03385 [Kaistella sp.]